MSSSDLLALGKRRAEELKLYSVELSNMPQGFNIAQPFFIASDVHALLGAGVEVLGLRNPLGWNTFSEEKSTNSCQHKTHSALLIGIKPLKVESEERKLLREFVEHDCAWKIEARLIERAKALLEGG